MPDSTSPDWAIEEGYFWQDEDCDTVVRMGEACGCPPAGAAATRPSRSVTERRQPWSTRAGALWYSKWHTKMDSASAHRPVQPHAAPQDLIRRIGSPHKGPAERWVSKNLRAMSQSDKDT
jgi:hypothetical protein